MSVHNSQKSPGGCPCVDTTRESSDHSGVVLIGVGKKQAFIGIRIILPSIAQMECSTRQTDPSLPF